MSKSRKLSVYLFALLVVFFVIGCGAVQLTGDLIRNFSEDVEIALSPGVTVEELKQKKNIAVSVNSSFQNKTVVAAYGTGGANENVISDMITMEFMQMGYSAKTLVQNVTDTSSDETFQELAKKGFDIVLVGNMNVGTTTSTTSHLTGGNIADTGILSFTIKGIDCKTGSVLFIISSEYGKSKRPKVVAENLANIYNKMLDNELEAS